MKSKFSLVLIIVLSVFVCVLIGGYIYLKILTSEQVIKAKIVSALEDATGGKLKIESAHFDIFKGLNLNKVMYEGKSPEHLRIEAEEIYIRHEPLALLRGQILINSIMIMSPELFIVREKDAIWRFLNGIKALMDHAEFKYPSDHLRSGFIAKNTNVHVFDEVIFREGRLDIENMDLFAQPLGGSLRDINIKGIVNDGIWKGFEVNVDTNLATPELKLVAHLRNEFMTETLMKELPVIGEKFWKTYSPTGKFDFNCLLDFNNKNNEKKLNYNLNLDINDGEFMYIKWPFLLKHVKGTIEYSKDGVFLRSLKGNVQNDGQEPLGEMDAYFGVGNAKKKIDINIPNSKITEKLLKMIPGIGEKVRVNYDPQGNIDINISYESNEDKSISGYSVKAMCKGIDVKYPDFPYRISNVVGLIEMDGENVYFKNMSGFLLDKAKMNHAILDGKINLKSQEKKFTISIRNLDLTEDIVKSIPERGEDLWSKYKPTGYVDLTIKYNGHKDKSKDEYFITADCKGNEIEYTKLNIKVSDIIGRIVIDKDNIQLKNLRGYIINDKQYSRVTFKGVSGLRNKNQTMLLSTFNLKVTDYLLNTFSELIKSEWFQIQPEGWVDVTYDYESKDEDPKGSYSVVIDTEGCTLKLSRIPLSISEINTRLIIEKGYLVSKDFSGVYAGSRINGSINYDKTSSDEEYTGELRFKDIDLTELVGKFFKTQKELSGVCVGKIEFHGRGNNLMDFVAEGHAKLEEAYITDVPLLLNILKLLNLSIPKKETFHTAEVKYSIKDKIINIEEIKVLSDTIELSGVGKVGFDGALDLLLVAGFNQEAFSQIPIIGQLMDYVVAGVRKKLTKVQITGTFLNPKSTLVALKPFKHPVRSLSELLSNNVEKKGDDGKIAEGESAQLDGLE